MGALGKNPQDGAIQPQDVQDLPDDLKKKQNSQQWKENVRTDHLVNHLL